MSRVVPLGVLVAALLTGCGRSCTGLDSDSPSTDDSADDSSVDTAPPVADVAASIHEEQGSVVLVSWEQQGAATARVEYRQDEGAWASTPQRNVEAGPAQQPILGIPYGEELSYRLVLGEGDDSWTSAEGSIRTDDPPALIPTPDLLVAEDSQQDPTAQYFVASINEDGAYFDGPWWTVIFDRSGRLVWAKQTPTGFCTLQVQPTQDGTAILVDHNSFWVSFDKGEASTVLRTTLDGAVQVEYAVPGLQHAFTETRDGLVLWGANTPNETLEEVTPEGEQRSIWSCDAFHDSLGIEHLCSSNHLFWHEPTDSVLFSFFNTVTVVEIDRQTGESLRWFGDLPDAWAFEPEDSAFYWQHGVSYTDAGTLLLSTEDERGGDETIVREYELNTGAEVLEQVWTFGLGDGLYSESHSDARRLPNGNTLHNLGSTARLREATPDGTVVWDLDWGDSQVLGFVTPIYDLYAMWP